MQKAALIVGIDSAIGSALQKLLTAEGWSVFGTTRRKENRAHNIFYLDLANLKTFHFLTPVDVVFLCASVTNMASCRINGEYAQKVNEEAQIRLADIFLAKATQIVFLSTSAVFSGARPAYRKSDPTCPRTLYGAYKANVENKLLRMGDCISIVRLTKVLTPQYPLILQWRNALTMNQIIEPFYDLRLCPVSIKIVVQILKELVEKRIFGIIHLSGKVDISYQKVAECLADLMGLDYHLIRPRSAFSSGVIREEAPPYTSLDMTETKNAFAVPDTSLMTTLTDLYGDILCNASFAHH